ncbi:MAG: DUF389 domain-containing protein [Acidobacteriota bacterium]
MPNRSAVGFSHSLGLVGATALAAGTAVPVAWMAAEPVIAASALGPSVHLLAGLLLLPVILARLDVPSLGGAYAGVRGGPPGLAFAVGWGLIAGYLSIAALLAQALATRLAALAGAVFGLVLEPWWLLPPILGLVAVNELIGTRGRSRPLVVAVGVSLVGLAIAAAAGLGSSSPAAPPTLPTSPVGVHQLLPVALLAAVLWGPEMVLARRPVMRRSAVTAPRAIGLAWIAAHALGAVAVLLALRRPDLQHFGEISGGPGWADWSTHRPELVLAGAFGVLCLLGLSQGFAGALRLTHELAYDGFLPAITTRYRSQLGVLFIPWLVGVGSIAWTVTGVSQERLLKVAAAVILGVSMLTLWPHARRRRRDLPRRAFALPWHPLGPLAATASGLFLIVLLRPGVGLVMWLALGGLYFLLAGRRRAAEVAAVTRVVGEIAEVDPEVGRVLVAVGSGPTVESLVRVGAAIARERGDELLVLHIEPMVEQVPFFVGRSAAQRARARLEERVDAVLPPEDRPPTHTLVRLAPSIAEGILDTVSELGADQLVLGWAGGEEGEPSAGVEPVVERVFPATSRSVVVLHGSLPKTLGSVLVATAGGPHAANALAVARALGQQAEDVAILNVVTAGGRETRPIAEGEEALRQTFDKAGEDAAPSVGRRVVHAPTIEEGIAREAGLQDVLLLGAAIDRLFGQTVLGGFPARIAESRLGPTIVVKRAEKKTRFWSRRVWEWLSGALPTLDEVERVQVKARMRQSARADVDFYVLICLSAGIATLGLMQSSPAVVIGAMLVAPLMSPILAMGHALVLGYWRLMRRAASSTAKGIGLAIAVGIVFAQLFPSIGPTPEMLGRGAPSLLDLLVALISGAAAAYAVSRSSVAAALPGVAIAAALVPPLCVVGYGLGASELALAGGAMLLFTTNLAGIVLSGAVIFLLLGVRPVRAAAGHGVWRALLGAVVFLGLVSVPLSLETRDTLQRSRVESRIEAGVDAAAVSDRFTLHDLVIERETDRIVIQLTVVPRDEDAIEMPALAAARDRLEADLGRPVRLRVTALRGTTMEIGD